MCNDTAAYRVERHISSSLVAIVIILQMMWLPVPSMEHRSSRISRLSRKEIIKNKEERRKDGEREGGVGWGGCLETEREREKRNTESRPVVLSQPGVRFFGIGCFPPQNAQSSF